MEVSVSSYKRVINCKGKKLEKFINCSVIHTHVHTYRERKRQSMIKQLRIFCLISLGEEFVILCFKNFMDSIYSRIRKQKILQNKFDNRLVNY